MKVILNARMYSTIKNNFDNAKIKKEAMKVRLSKMSQPIQQQTTSMFEDEFRSEVASSLGRAERKLLDTLRIVNNEYQKLGQQPNFDKRKFELARMDAIQARFNLACQRQAVGFNTDNDEALMERYPIPRLPDDFVDSKQKKSNM